MIQRFHETWLVANRKPLATFPAEKPNRQIDYVLLRPSDRWRVVGVDVVDEPLASDHRPIIADLELLPRRGHLLRSQSQ